MNFLLKEFVRMEQKSKQIIAVVGMPGSGKSTVIQTLVKEYHLPSIHFGNLTIQEMRKRNLPENQESEKKVRQELRDRYGMGAYAHLSLPEIERLFVTHDSILIDGLYSWKEYILLKEKSPAQIFLVSVISRRKERYRRLAIRPYRPLTHEEAEKRDFAEIETLEKGGPIALCDYYLTNDGGLEELKRSIRDIASALGLSDRP